MSQVQVAQNFSEALRVQARVVWALMLREIKTMYGRSRFGYLWVVIQTAFGVCVFWAFRAALGSRDEHGLSLPVFLITGFCAWNVFSEAISKVMVAIDANQALLFYSKVRHFDLVLARVLLVGATNVVVLILLMLVVYVGGFNFTLNSLWPFIIAWFFLMVCGAGLGMLACALKRYSDSVAVIVPMIMRIAIFVSGVLFSYNALPHSLRFLAEYNPVFQLIEYSRLSFSYVYPGDILNLEEVSLFALTVFFVGMFVETATRKKRDVI